MWLLVVSPIESTRTGRSWHVVRGWSAWSNRCPACSDAYTNELNYVVAHFRGRTTVAPMFAIAAAALCCFIYRPPRCCSSPTPRRRPQRPRWTSTSDISRTQVNDETINHEWPFLKAPYLLAGLECYYYSLRQSVRHPFYGRTKKQSIRAASAPRALPNKDHNNHLIFAVVRMVFFFARTSPPPSLFSVGRWSLVDSWRLPRVSACLSFLFNHLCRSSFFPSLPSSALLCFVISVPVGAARFAPAPTTITTYTHNL